MGFFAAIANSYVNILSFSGRASRSEYWCFLLFQILVIFTGSFAVGLLVGSTEAAGLALDPATSTSLMGIFSVVFLIFFQIPSITSTVRRLHDTGRSGWWFWIPILPIIGTIILLVLLLQRGTQGHNQFGRDPLNPASRRRNAPKVYAPEIREKRARNEAARRAEIMDYYRKNVASNT